MSTDNNAGSISSPASRATKPNEIAGISSMATRQVLAELVKGFKQHSKSKVSIEPAGGVDVAKRVQSGEIFDVVFLGCEAIDKLITSGHIRADSKMDLFRSAVAVAVREGAQKPDISTEETLKQAVRTAKSISYSTGPSGVALAALFVHWGIAEELKSRIVQPAPGIPVGTLIAKGDVELGFQQYSELMDVEGITVLGTLPISCAIETVFSAGIPCTSTCVTEVQALLDYMASPGTNEIKKKSGMDPA